MKLIAQVKLQPSPQQHTALLDTLERANDAANHISRVARDTKTFKQYDLQKLTYAHIRQTTGLAAQLVIRLLAKVADAYKLDRNRQRVFRRNGSIAYDDRIIHWYADHVTIWTTAGRQRIGFVCDERSRLLLATRQGETDLIYRDGKWYLAATVEYREPPAGEAQDFLGLD